MARNFGLITLLWKNNAWYITKPRCFSPVLSIHTSTWITLQLYCPSISFAKTSTQKSAIWDTVFKSEIVLLACNLFYLTTAEAKQTSYHHLCPLCPLSFSWCHQSLYSRVGLGVKPLRTESVDYFKCVSTFLCVLKAYEKGYNMTASNTRGLDLMTQRGPLEPYTPNHLWIVSAITIGSNLIVYFLEQVKLNSTGFLQVQG